MCTMKPLVMTGTAQSEPSHSATSSSVATEQIKNIPSCRHTTSNSANTETSQMKISAEPSKWQQPYYMAKGILIDQINTLSLRCGGPFHPSLFWSKRAPPIYLLPPHKCAPHSPPFASKIPSHAWESIENQHSGMPPPLGSATTSVIFFKVSPSRRLTSTSVQTHKNKKSWYFSPPLTNHPPRNPQ